LRVEQEVDKMNIDEAVNMACKEPTLLEALSWICVWESERAIMQAKKNLHDIDGKGWDTCFKPCLRKVMEQWQSLLELPEREQPKKCVECSGPNGFHFAHYTGPTLLEDKR
jgi:hypothetical protein